MVAPVVPRPQQVLPPTVVGHLVQDPVALQHAEGVDLTEVEAVVHRGAVLRELHHLAPVIFPLVESDSVGAALWIRQSADKGKSGNLAFTSQPHSALGGWAFLYLFYIKGNNLKRQPTPRPLCTFGKVNAEKLKRAPFT